MEKEIVKGFKGKELLQEAMELIIKDNRDSATTKVRDLYVKKYQTVREVEKIKVELKKAEESLLKTESKLEEVKKGNFSVLFQD